MRKLFLMLLFIHFCQWVFSQNSPSYINRPPVDTSVLDKWPKLSNGALSNNGEYVLYVVSQYIPHRHTTTIVQATHGSWRTELRDVESAVFTNNSRQLLFKKPNDSLCIMKLGGSNYDNLGKVKSFKLIPYNGGEWLVYQLASESNDLIIDNLEAGRKRQFPFIISYAFSKDGSIVVLQTRSVANENMLKWVDLSTDNQANIWSETNKKVSQIVFDDRASQLVFIAEEKGKREIWHYQHGETAAANMAKDGDTTLPKGLAIGNIDRFSIDGSRLFFTVEKRQVIGRKPQYSSNVNIWSYHDLMPQSEQLEVINRQSTITKNYFSVLLLKNKRVIQLQQESDRLSISRIKNDDFCLLRSLDTDKDVSGAEAWNPIFKKSKLYLVSTFDGSRKSLPWQHKAFFSSELSPGGKFIVYYEKPDLNYYSYEVATGITRNITSSIKTDLTADIGYRKIPESYKSLIEIAGWAKDDAGIFIYDRNDIWLVDPMGKRLPENITNGYGLRHGIVFRLDKQGLWSVPLGQKLILVAFNERTKTNGYFSKVFGQKGDPIKLILDDCLYSSPLVSSRMRGDLIKAKDVDAWLVTRQNAKEFPNYFWTTDLKTFKRISGIRPEKAWNWLTAELHTWRAQDGEPVQGVLYKPESFDSTKKYPVIFCYYRQLSNLFHQYIKPEWITDNINIPWFVSKGYIVFVPDIYQNIPNLKESVLDCVISGGKYISKLSFVDSNRMGINGHSFGGLETGYLVTNTNLFAAACASSGYYNLISDNGSVLYHGSPRNTSVAHMGGTVWEKRDDYIKNSSIFYVDKVTTPLLLMRGEKDGQVPSDQSLEFFLGLRRLNKKAWMLSYEEADHVLVSSSDKIDFTIRMTQFFDHYLKNAPAPIWMSRGIPAKLKGIETGYVLDPTGNCGKECKVCKSWNEKYQKDSVATMQEIERRRKAEHWQ